MEKFYSLLNRLNGEDDVVSFVDKRKIICEEENETHYKGSYWSKGRKICLNKVREGVSFGYDLLGVFWADIGGYCLFY